MPDAGQNGQPNKWQLEAAGWVSNLPKKTPKAPKKAVRSSRSSDATLFVLFTASITLVLGIAVFWVNRAQDPEKVTRSALRTTMHHTPKACISYLLPVTAMCCDSAHWPDLSANVGPPLCVDEALFSVDTEKKTRHLPPCRRTFACCC